MLIIGQRISVVTTALITILACTSQPDYCGKDCSLSEPCATGYTCNGLTGMCVATDGHCSATTGGAASSSGTNGGASTGGSSTTAGATGSGGSSGGNNTTGGSSSGGFGPLPAGGPFALGTNFADQGTLACGGSLSPVQTGTSFINQGILGSRGAGHLMKGTNFQNQGGFLSQ